MNHIRSVCICFMSSDQEPRTELVPDPEPLLVFSSSWFILPVVFAYQHRLYHFATITTLDSVVSATYWMWPHPITRNADIAVAHASFLYYTYHGVVHVPWFPSVMVGWPLMATSLYLYFVSCSFHRARRPEWVYFHALFHYCQRAASLQQLTS